MEGGETEKVPDERIMYHDVWGHVYGSDMIWGYTMTPMTHVPVVEEVLSLHIL